MPAAFYRGTSTKSRQPVFFSGQRNWSSSKQIWKHLLCRTCEDRFNKLGEKWVNEHRLRADGSFPLLAGLKVGSTPLPLPRNVGVPYPANAFVNLDVNRLAYFASSVFWRAGVCDWGEKRLAQLNLGAYGEQLRGFLTGTSNWPASAIIRVTIINSFEPKYMRAVFPLGGRDLNTRGFAYSFYIPGIRFDLYLDKRMQVRPTCLLGNAEHPLFLAGDDRFRDLVRAVRTGRNWP